MDRKRLWSIRLSSADRDRLRDVSFVLELTPSETVRVGVEYLLDRISCDGLPAQELMQFLAARELRRQTSKAKGGQ